MRKNSKNIPFRVFNQNHFIKKFINFSSEKSFEKYRNNNQNIFNKKNDIDNWRKKKRIYSILERTNKDSKRRNSIISVWESRRVDWNEWYTTPMGKLELGKVIVMQSKEVALAS